MLHNINILCWNVRGVISSSLCLCDMLVQTKCDIAIICEHKLKCINANYLDTMNRDYCSMVCIENCDSNDHVTNRTAFLGKGGVGIMYKKTLQFSVVEIPDIASPRIIGVELRRKHSRPLYIFGVYLPSDSNVQSYVNELNLLEALFNNYSSYGDVIIGGDFNASCKDTDHPRSNRYKSKAMKDVIFRCDLGCPDIDFKTTGSKHTFTQTCTTLDYIFCNKDLCNYVNEYHVYEEGTFSSTSDHLPIYVNLCTDIKTHVLHEPTSSLPAWHKVNHCKLKEYENYLKDRIQFFLDRELKSVEDLDLFCLDLNNLLHAAASLHLCIFPTLNTNTTLGLSGRHK